MTKRLCFKQCCTTSHKHIKYDATRFRVAPNHLLWNLRHKVSMIIVLTLTTLSTWTN